MSPAASYAAQTRVHAVKRAVQRMAEAYRASINVILMFPRSLLRAPVVCVTGKVCGVNTTREWGP